MQLPSPRGPISARVISALRDGRSVDAASEPDADLDLRGADPLSDDDLHLALWVLYELHYRGFDDVGDEREWDAGLISLRGRLEAVFEEALRHLVEDLVAVAEGGADVVEQIRSLIEAADGPDLARYVQRDATHEEFLDLIVQRSIYTLKESDPSSFVLPRLDGAAKAALAELLYDEYGGGRPDRLHATLFARAMDACGLDSRYGAYVEQATGPTLALNNAMSLFCLHRRLRGAALGHLAAFESTSTLPCRRIATGVQRLGLGDAVWDYFDEHVEADAVHEEVALRSICAPVVAADPSLLPEVLFGAAACLALDSASAAALLRGWGTGVPGHTRASDRVSA